MGSWRQKSRLLALASLTQTSGHENNLFPIWLCILETDVGVSHHSLVKMEIWTPHLALAGLKIARFL